jgi:hypothetical protein
MKSVHRLVPNVVCLAVVRTVLMVFDWVLLMQLVNRFPQISTHMGRAHPRDFLPL